MSEYDSVLKVYDAVDRPAKTAEEKHAQLKRDFATLSNEPKKLMQITIKHALKQCALVGSYSGFSTEFWVELMGIELKQ